MSSDSESWIIHKSEVFVFPSCLFLMVVDVMVKRYRTVKLPAKMLEAVEQLVKDHPEYGYSSIADFVKDSVRHHYLGSVHRIKIVEE